MFTIEPGVIADYDRLAHLHPRPSRPATCARILVARDSGSPEPIAILIVSMPVLNAPWRHLAWPGRYATGDKRADARRINAELRTISRVIVAPAHRARGVAAALVRAYLAEPLTPATESLVLRPRPCRFFTDAGMTPYPLAPSPHHARLADALAHVRSRSVPPAVRLRGLPVPNVSALPHRQSPRAATACGTSRFISSELRTWARSSRATARMARTPRLCSLLRLARPHLRPLAFAYAHTLSFSASTSASSAFIS